MELALSGGGVYLGITDKDKLLHQLEVLQTKEAQLQKKELYLMAGTYFCTPSVILLPLLVVNTDTGKWFCVVRWTIADTPGEGS